MHLKSQNIAERSVACSVRAAATASRYSASELASEVAESGGITYCSALSAPSKNSSASACFPAARASFPHCFFVFASPSNFRIFSTSAIGAGPFGAPSRAGVLGASVLTASEATCVFAPWSDGAAEVAAGRHWSPESSGVVRKSKWRLCRHNQRSAAAVSAAEPRPYRRRDMSGVVFSSSLKCVRWVYWPIYQDDDDLKRNPRMPVKNFVYQRSRCIVEDIKGVNKRIAWGRRRNNRILRHGWRVRFGPSRCSALKPKKRKQKEENKKSLKKSDIPPLLGSFNKVTECTIIED